MYFFLGFQELYHELQVLDRFEQDYQRKRQEEDNSGGTQKAILLFIFTCLFKQVFQYCWLETWNIQRDYNSDLYSYCTEEPLNFD